MGRLSIAFTVDVEDWPQSSWDRSLPIGEYCADNARRLLDLMAEYPSVRGTFFVLGDFAVRHPRVVDAIRQAGHEVGSHGFGHVELFQLGPEKFAETLRRGADAIFSAAGVKPVGYRAPDFSIVGESLWALDVLAEHGFQYDSSIFPIAKARYGIVGWPRRPVHVQLKSGARITEFPLGTLEWRGRAWPVGGGGYARLLPGRALVWLLKRANAQLRDPPVFYCHPYELDPDEFRRLQIPIPRKVRLHQGLGRSRTAGKLRRLFAQFDCLSLCQVLAGLQAPPTITYDPYVLAPGDVVRPPIFAEAAAPPATEERQ